MTNSKRNAWIDAAKTVAIIGVVFQHLWGWAYDDEILYNSVFYAVGLFVIIGGYNTYGSYLRRGSCPVLKRIVGIMIPYAAATVIYVAASGNGKDPAEYILRLVHFDACAPMYYVAVYTWLVIASPVLALVLNKCLRAGSCVMKMLRLGLSIVAVVIVSYLCTRYTDIFGIILGGGMVFAGPWLMFHYVGMCIRGLEQMIAGESAACPEAVGTVCTETGAADTGTEDRKKEKKDQGARRRKGFILLMLLTLSLLAWEYIFVIKEVNKGFGAIFGYGDILLTWFGGLEILLMMLWFVTAGRIAGYTKEREAAGGEETADSRKIPAYGQIFMAVLGLLGRHSLYIFLYHILFLRLYVDHLLTRMLHISHLLNRITLILTVFAGPVIISVIVNRLKTLCFSK